MAMVGTSDFDRGMVSNPDFDMDMVNCYYLIGAL